MEENQSESVSFFVRSYKSYIRLIKEPVTSGKRFVLSEDFIVAIVFMIFQAILVAGFAVIFETGISRYVEEISAFISEHAVIEFIKEVLISEITIPYQTVFLGTFLISLSLSVILALLIFVFNNIFGNRINFRHALCVSSLRTTVIIPFFIISSILTVVNPFLGLLFLFLAGIWIMGILIMVVPSTDEKKENRIPLIMFFVFVIFTLISLMIMFKTYSIFLPEIERNDLRESVIIALKILIPKVLK